MHSEMIAEMIPEMIPKWQVRLRTVFKLLLDDFRTVFESFVLYFRRSRSSSRCCSSRDTILRSSCTFVGDKPFVLLPYVAAGFKPIFATFQTWPPIFLALSTLGKRRLIAAKREVMR